MRILISDQRVWRDRGQAVNLYIYWEYRNAQEKRISEAPVNHAVALYSDKKIWLPGSNPLHNHSLFVRSVGNEEIGVICVNRE